MSAGMPDLYFIHNPKLGLVKIGMTVSAEFRLRELKQGHACDCHDSLEVARVVQRGGLYEQELHSAFASSRRRGEWFAITATLQAIMGGNVSVKAFVQERRRAWRRGRPVGIKAALKANYIRQAAIARQVVRRLAATAST